MLAFEIIQFPGVKLVGCLAEMSYSAHQPAVLWQKLMPLRHKVLNKSSGDLYSGEIYPAEFFNQFNPHLKFTKLAGIPVTQAELVPDGLGVIDIPPGSYAKFVYKGTSEGAAEFYNAIFTSILPSAGLTLANRPHLAVMGEKYRNNDPDSEEHILIPILT